jgi:hydroxymethylbilane synthase
VGAYAELVEDGLLLAAFVGTPDGDTWIRDAALAGPDQAAALGAALGERLLAAGAGDVLAAAEARAT